jgi:hypothetical protein
LGLKSAGIDEIRIFISREQRVIRRIGSFQSFTSSPVEEVVDFGDMEDDALLRVVEVVESDCWEV